MDHWSIIVPSAEPPDHILPIHQFRRKPNKYWKTPLTGIEPRTYWSQNFIPPSRCH
ncbi:hypothetical protein Hanom_Chr07g00632791 [Helianthus anomalus]